MIYACIDNVDTFFLVLHILPVFSCYFMYHTSVLKLPDCRMKTEIIPKKTETRFYHLPCDNMI